MKSFYDFVTEVSVKSDMGNEFFAALKISSAEELNLWFIKKGYETPIEDCIKIIEKKKDFIEIRVR
ncbi:MAG: hypothetical protein GY754_19475 [bacterium]|nr:hypothetical protein [bacterium]